MKKKYYWGVGVDSGQVWIGDLQTIPVADQSHVLRYGVVVPVSGRFTPQVTMHGNYVAAVTLVSDPQGPVAVSQFLAFIDPAYIPFWGTWGDGGIYDQCCHITCATRYGPVAGGFVTTSGGGDGEYPVESAKTGITIHFILDNP